MGRKGVCTADYRRGVNGDLTQTGIATDTAEQAHC